MHRHVRRAAVGAIVTMRIIMLMPVVMTILVVVIFVVMIVVVAVIVFLLTVFQVLQRILQTMWQFEVRQIVVFIFFEHDDSAEQATIDGHRDVAAVIVERPRADHLLRHVEGVDPVLARTDLV